MKFLLPALFLGFLFLFSCGSKEDKTEGVAANDTLRQIPPQDTASNDKKNKGKKSNGEKEKKDKPGDIRVRFPEGSTQVTLNGTINGFGQNIYYVFEVRKGQKLTSRVKPKSGSGNIRISQIIDPTGKADGPFGGYMTYALDKAGDWKIVLNENMMSGKPWAGEYLLTIEIK